MHPVLVYIVRFYHVYPVFFLFVTHKKELIRKLIIEFTERKRFV